MLVLGDFICLNVSLPKNARKNQVQFLRLTIKRSRFLRQRWFRRSNHTQEKLRFLRFFHATPDGVFEIFLGNAFVRFAIIRADARATTNNLANQSVVLGIVRNFFHEPDDCLTELCRPFF